MTSDLTHLVDGPTKAPVTIILAHGAGAPMDSPFMEAFAQGIATHGLRCVRFEFPYMAERRTSGKKKPPDRMPVLLECWRQVMEAFAGSRLIIGGKSMGGRVAGMLAVQRESEGRPADGLVCMGYPFHPPGSPGKLRTDHLTSLQTPTLILQGTRDPFGTPEEVDGFGLPPCIRLHWLEDGDHGFKPRKKSGRTEQQNWDEAINALVAFAHQCVTRRG